VVEVFDVYLANDKNPPVGGKTETTMPRVSACVDEERPAAEVVHDVVSVSSWGQVYPLSTWPMKNPPVGGKHRPLCQGTACVDEENPAAEVVHDVVSVSSSGGCIRRLLGQ